MSTSKNLCMGRAVDSPPPSPSQPPSAAHVSFDVKPYEKLLPNCSWQIMATPVSFPTTLPEWSCIYQSSVLRNLTTTRHAKITGAFRGVAGYCVGRRRRETVQSR